MDFYQNLYTSDPSYSPLGIGISVAIAIIAIVTYWKIFSKANQPGWKAIIPIYNSYIIFKIAWKARWFVFNLIISAACIAVGSISIVYMTQANTLGMTLLYISLFILLIVLVIEILLNIKLSRVFGHGIWFGLGLTFLSPIFLLILAFGKSEYSREIKVSPSSDNRQISERNKPNGFRDFFYDKNDIIVVLIIVALAGLIIYSRIGSIMKYPEVLADKAAKTQTEETIKASSSSDNSSQSGIINITIETSDTAATVAQKLFDTGVITSTSEFEKYITDQGKTDSIKTGTFQIPSSPTNEEILNIIAN